MPTSRNKNGYINLANEGKNLPMTQINTDTQKHIARYKKHNASFRIWHWVNMILILGSLITVLINSQLTSKAVLGKVEAELVLKQKPVAHDDAFNVNHELREKVWTLHTYIGYFIIGLLVMRIITELYTVREQKFWSKLKLAYAGYIANKKIIEEGFHQLGIKITYCIFYMLMLLMSVTGLMLAFEDNMELLKTYHKPIKKVHNFGMYIMLGFIVLHIAGVIYTELRKEKGIVSDMIHGGEVG